MRIGKEERGRGSRIERVGWNGRIIKAKEADRSQPLEELSILIVYRCGAALPVVWEIRFSNHCVIYIVICHRQSAGAGGCAGVGEPII